MYNEEIAAVLYTAFRNTVTDLRKKHREQFYYYVFVSDSPLCPYVSACSHESYRRLLESGGNDEGEEEDERNEENEDWLKWDFCDSEYCVYGYDEFFGDAERLLAKRAEKMNDDELYGDEWETRLASMEEALRRLDNEGFFGTGEERKKVIINVECAPPSGFERERALCLNPESELLCEYLQFCEEAET